MAKKFIIRKRGSKDLFLKNGEWGTGCKWSNTNAPVDVDFELVYWDHSFLCVNMIRDRIDANACIYAIEEV